MNASEKTANANAVGATGAASAAIAVNGIVIEPMT